MTELLLHNSGFQIRHDGMHADCHGCCRKSHVADSVCYIVAGSLVTAGTGSATEL